MDTTEQEITDRWMEVALIEHYGRGPDPAGPARVLEAFELGEMRGMPELVPETRGGFPHLPSRVAAGIALVAASVAIVLLLVLPLFDDEAVTPPGTKDSDGTDQDTAPLISITETGHPTWEHLEDGDVILLTRGTIHLQAEPGVTYEVRAADFSLKLHGPCEVTASLTPMQNVGAIFGGPDNLQGRSAQLERMQRFEFVMLNVSVDSGRVELTSGEDTTALSTDSPVQRFLSVEGRDEAWARPLTPVEVFRDLDMNDDGQLAGGEVTQAFIARADTDSNGRVNQAEWQEVWKLQPADLPRIIPPARLIAEMDADGNGRLDDSEVPSQLIGLGDRDDSGDLDATEAERLIELLDTHETGGGGPPAITDLFDFLDQDDDGRLSAREVRAEIIAHCDDNDDGELDREEFKAYPTSGFAKPMTDEQEFDRADKNDDGYITSDETEAGLVRFADSDGDGKISLEEYLEAFGTSD